MYEIRNNVKAKDFGEDTRSFLLNLGLSSE